MVAAGPSASPSSSSPPSPTSALIGRRREVAASGTLLCGPARLVTITGPGGIGKTRVALSVAASLGGARAGAGKGAGKGAGRGAGKGAGKGVNGTASPFQRVVFVPLATLDDPRLVAAAVARAFGIAETNQTLLPRRLADALGAEPTLLVLDNFEHLLPAAPLIAELLASCETLSVLATSRAPLRLSGEHEYPLAPLDETTAAELFVQRARAARPDFRLTPDTERSVGEICARLDGLPLAIELAAARLKLLGPAALLSRLSRRLALLTGGPRDLPARQQTLRSTLDWSYALLTPAERLLFARLGLFSGGWTLDAAEGVATDAAGGEGQAAAESALEHFTTLVDNSLVIRTETADGEPRFSMLETMREYALERLATTGKEAVARLWHAQRYADLAQTAGAHLRGPDQALWLDRLEREHANVRDALRWWIDQAAQPANPAETAHTVDAAHAAQALSTALAMGGALWRYWWVRGYLSEGRALLAALIECSEAAGDPGEHTAARAEIAFGAGVLAYTAADFEPARQHYLAARDLWLSTGDESGVAYAVENLGEVDLAIGRTASARTHLEDSVARFRSLGDDGGVAWPLTALGMCHLVEGDASTARAMLEEGLILFRQLGDRLGEALGLDMLALVEVEQGDPAAARDRVVACLSIRRQLGERTGLGFTLEVGATLAAAAGHFEGAARLAAAGAGLRAAYGSPILEPFRATLDGRLAPVRQRLGDAAFERVWKETYGADPEAAVTAALEVLALPKAAEQRSSATATTERPDGGLSPRELEVAALVAAGLSNREIAARLTITPSTAGVHVGHILDKLGLHTRAQIAAWVTARRPPDTLPSLASSSRT